MTIHSDWARILHEECPEAFVRNVPKGKCSVGILDGHLQLMRLHPCLENWATFVRTLFVKPLKMMLDAGCKRVVLCFDSYGSVPAYKNMTQLKRCSKHEVRTFGEQQPLPQHIPDDPMPFLMNRHFKVRVIEMLCEEVPKRMPLKEGQSLIIDYRRVVEYTTRSPAPTPIPDLVPMGESDVKFCRYVERYGNALVHAIDGDYLMIALLYYAQQAGGLSGSNRIFIFRQFAALQSHAPRKRKKGEEEEEATTFTMVDNGKRMVSPANNKCWVDMQLLYVIITASLRQVLPTNMAAANFQTGAPETVKDNDLIMSAVFLMLLAGTDFSRGLPLLGPKRLWDLLPSIGLPLVLSTRNVSKGTVGEEGLNVATLTDGVIGTLYGQVFEKHTPRHAQTFEKVMQGIQASKLAPSTKSRIPGAAQVACTIRNVAWVMRYWCTINGCVQTPLEGENGYVRSGTQITFADHLAASDSMRQ